jgi:hypothetical protein
VIDYNTATAQECADWLAGEDGWNHEPPQVDGMGDQREYWWKWTISSAHGGRTYAYSHPYPLTLDGAAGALRECWWVKVRKEPRFKTTPMWMVSAADTHADGGRGYNELEAVADDELTARYRLAVAARLDGMEGRG